MTRRTRPQPERRQTIGAFLLAVGGTLALAFGLGFPPVAAQEDAGAEPVSRAAQVAESDPAALREEAIARWRADDRDGAIALLAQALAASPDDVDTLLVRGQNYRKMGNTDAALADLNRVIALAPEHAPTHAKALSSRGNLLAQTGRAPEGIVDLRRVTELKPDDVNAWGSLGWYLILEGRWDEARTATARAVELNSDSYAWTVNLGHTYLLSGDTEGAYQHYRDTLALIPDRAALDSGPLADFDLFIERGWQVPASREARAWIEAAYERDFTRANELNTEGHAAYRAGEYPKARDAFAASLALRERSLGQAHPKVAVSLNNLGQVHAKLGEHAQAKALIERALRIDEAVYGPDHPKVATEVNNLAGVYQALGDLATAKRLYERALRIDEAVYGPDHPEVATDVNNLALVYQALGDLSTAKGLYERALKIDEAVYGPEHPKVAIGVNNLALVYQALGDLATAKGLYERALRIDEAVYGPEHPEVATEVNNLAGVYQDLGDLATAKGLYERALRIDEAVYGPDHPDVARDVNNLALVYKALGDLATAKGLYERALRIDEAVYGPDHPKVAIRVNNLAGVYRALGDLATAKGLYERALKIDEAVYGPDHPDAARDMNNLAMVYRALGDPATAKALIERALRIGEAVYGPDHPDIAKNVNNLAVVYQDLGDLATAKGLYERALCIDEAVYGPDHPNVATAVNNLAGVYRALGDLATAKGLFERALGIDEAVYGPDHPEVATTVNNLALVYRDLGDLATAKGLFERVLPIAQLANRPELSWTVEGNLSDLHAAANRPALAIFYGKQAVNTLQAQRGRLSELEAGLQSSFLSGVEKYYKRLSDLLIAQGRLPEAQQVLELLKQQELYDFVRRDADTAAGDAAAYSAFEQQQLGAYQAASAELTDIGRELLELEAIKPFARGPEQQARIDTLRPQLDAAHRDFQAALERIEQAFAAIAQDDRREELAERQLGNDNRGLVRAVAAAGGSDAVLIHYLMLDERLHILLTTSRVLLARQVQVPAATLNTEIQALRAALQDPHIDPRPAARVLYERLIAPIAADLKGAGAKTLMVSLDGALRYVPLAALHDGERWLIERWAVSVFTEAARDRVALAPQTDWYLAGLGLSEARPGFTALAAVPAELDGIVRSDADDTDGVLPGSIHLNNAFTGAVLSASLHDGYPVVHLASHFVFRPGTEKDSFLLLGDGTHLDLGELRLGDYDFGSVDLLTLSACETAVGGPGAHGREVEGFGALAQKKGAKGVLATLWPVADASTGQFMQDLYRQRTEHKLTKAEALRQAQLGFLGVAGDAAAQGDLNVDAGPVPTPAQADASAEPLDAMLTDPERTAVSLSSSVPSTGQPGPGAFPTDPARPYAHPYYWAPFILMGNWL